MILTCNMPAYDDLTIEVKRRQIIDFFTDAQKTCASKLRKTDSTVNCKIALHINLDSIKRIVS